MTDSRTAWTGVYFALLAGLMWGLVFVSPLLLPDYPPPLQSVGRYLAFGLIALPLAWLDRRRLSRLSAADWKTAFRLALVGNLLYYTCLSSAILRSGGPLPTIIIGTLPVVIGIAANRRDVPGEGRLPWRQLGPALLVIATGIACVNQSEFTLLLRTPAADPVRYGQGAILAVLALACWTWYPIRNADWLRQHADCSPQTWAIAQGIATLPLAFGGYAAFWGSTALGDAPFPMPFGPRPLVFIGLMTAMGLFASWLGTLCWNAASRRLPTATSGQLIVFETLSALAYTYLIRGEWPDRMTVLGIVLLMVGVLRAVRIQPESAQTP